MSGFAGNTYTISKENHPIGGSEDGHQSIATTFSIPKIFPLKRCLGKTTPLPLDNCPCAGFTIENMSQTEEIRWGGIGSDAPFIDQNYPGDSKGNRIMPGQEKSVPLDNTNKCQVVGIRNVEFQVTAYVNTLSDPQIDSANPPQIFPPTVTLTSPLNAAINVAANANIVITFNEPLDPTTVNASTVTISPSITHTRSLVGNVLTISHTPLFAVSTVYTVTLTTNITDVDGNPMLANYVFSFTTQGNPIVATQFPASGATNVGIDTLVYGILDKNAQAASVTASTFTISPSVSVTRFIDSLDPKKIVLDPVANLANSTLYTVTLTTGIKDSAGVPLAANSVWSFTTTASAPPADASLPTIVSKTPAASATQQPITVSPVIVFSEKMLASTINNTNIKILTDPGLVDQPQQLH